MNWNSKALSTRCIHAGEMDDAFGSPRTPLYTTTTFKQVIEERELKDSLLGRGIETMRSTPEEFAQLMRAEMAVWQQVINERNIKPD